MWWEPELTEPERSLARSFMETMRPWAADRALPNFISADEGAARLRASYGDEKFERLMALKDKYDPDNVFALNQNRSAERDAGVARGGVEDLPDRRPA